MTILISDKPEMNVVNVGDELTQNMIDALNGASGPSSANVYVTRSAGDSAYIEKDGGGTVVGTVVVDTDGTVGGNVTTITGTSVEVNNYGVGTIKMDPVLGITFPDSTSQATAAVTLGLATTAEAIAGTNTTKAVTAEGLLATAFYDTCWDATPNGSFGTSISGGGSSAGATTAFSKSVNGPTSAIGYAILRYTLSGHTVGISWNTSFNFSKKFDVSLMFGRNSGTDSNSEGWFVIGDGGTIVNTGSPNDQSFGIKIVGTNAYGFVHNGTTLSLSSAVSVTGAGTFYKATIQSNGAGTVTFNIAGTSLTMTGGPTGLVATAYRNAFSMKVINNAILTGSALSLFATQFKVRIIQ